MLWLVGLSAGLIDGLLLLPQDYRSSSPGGEGNSSEHSGEREREREESKRERGQKERERGTEVEVQRGCQYENGKKDKGRQR